MDAIADSKAKAATGTNTNAATLNVGDKSWAFPVYDGTIGPSVVDIARRIEREGAIPQSLLSMQDVGGDNDQGSPWHNAGPQRVRLARHPAQRRYRRVKPQRFLDDGPGHDETVDQTIVRSTQFPIGLLADALAPIRRLRQQKERPGQCVCRRFMPSGEERQNIRFDFARTHRPAGRSNIR